MKNIKILILGFALVLGMSSCKDWIQDIDVQDKETEDNVYSSRAGFESVLNGLYQKLGDSNLYGEDLTMGVVDILGQVFDMSAYTETNNPTRYHIAKYGWGNLQGLRKRIWVAAYTHIRNTNDLIKHLESSDALNVLGAKERNWMLGEAYALRAYMHFDLLRLYGPVYKTNSDAQAIIYNKKIEPYKGVFLSAKDVMTEVFADIDLALEYLKDDPILENGPDYTGSEEEGTFAFWGKRNYRLNIYAVKAFKARALMYANNPSEASALAKEVINDTDFQTYFPWADGELVAMGRDRIFSSDVLFAFYSQDMYKKYESVYDGAKLKEAYKMMRMGTDNVTRLFPNITLPQGDDDYRSKSLEKYAFPNGYYVTKFSKPSIDNIVWYMQPLIRKSELYYIIAEADGNSEMLKEVVDARKSKVPISTTFTQSELNEDFSREMLFEGQIFFHYKRLNASEIPTGVSTSVGMNENKYQMPYPEDMDKF